MNPRIDLYLEPYSTLPDLVLSGFVDASKTKETFAALMKCGKEIALPWFDEAVQRLDGMGISNSGAAGGKTVKLVGLAAIEQKQKENMKKDEDLTSEVFADLNELMSKATEVMELIKKCAGTMNAQSKDVDAFDSLLAEIGMVDNPVTKQTAGKKYHDALAKQIAQFLGLRNPPAAMTTLPDVFALYNRARGGADLVSPADLLAACLAMKRLELDFEHVVYPSGVQAVKNLKYYAQIQSACDELLKTQTKSVSASELSKAVPSLPLLIAKEWLGEQEQIKRSLARDRDAFGNVRWYANMYFM